MAIGRFFSRVQDALGALPTVDRASLAARLDDVVVTLDLRACESASMRDAALLAANLAARFYPTIAVCAEPSLQAEAAGLIHAINPAADVATDATGRGLTLALGATEAPDHGVAATAVGWTVAVDGWAADSDAAAEPLAALASAAVGCAELFRIALADALGSRGRRGPQPGGMNLVTLAAEPTSLPSLAADDLGTVHLVGAGAVGQAAVLALAAAHASGTVVVVDPERVEVSNLQRYVLARDADVGRLKTDVAAEALAAAGYAVVAVPSAWGDDPRTGPRQHCVLVAVDSAVTRMEIAAGVPDAAYNAWTQPADLGWSRHERFGDEPCLACLYYPTKQRPGDHELIAAALGEHPLRALGYLLQPMAVGAPLPNVPQVADIATPGDAQRWVQVPLLDDLVSRGIVAAETASEWAHRSIGELYRDGVCAGGVAAVGPIETDAVVPLAHQSALAGIMLTTSLLVATDPALRQARNPGIEARFDVLKGFPQIVARPRQRTPTCICSDADFLALVRQE